MPADRARRFGALHLTGALSVLAAVQPGPALAQVDANRSLVAQAVAYEHGEGVPKDLLKALTLYCEGARAGDPEAQFGLGWMYANGRGVTRDDRVAAGLFARAAAQGHEHAGRMLQAIGGDEGALLPDCMTMLPPAPPIATVADLPLYKPEIGALVHRLAPRFEVSPQLALAVIAVESGFNPSAVSPKNAQGLMQLLPGTAQRFNVKNAFDPAENVRGGLAYLRWLLSYYRGEVALALAAYNAGEGAVDRYRGVPPYPETKDYVRKILALFREDRHPYDERVTEPSPIVVTVARGKN